MRLEKLKEQLFFYGCIAIILDNIPKLLQLNILSSGFANKGAWYFFVAFLLLCVYQKINEKVVLVPVDKALMKYIGILMCAALISNIWGIIQYPYYDILLSGPLGQVEKMPLVMSFIEKYHMDYSYQDILCIWIGVRAIKGTLLGILFTFGISFAIYWTIKNYWRKYYSLLKKAILISIIIITSYSLVEAAYLAGNSFATNVLSIINPFLHPIAVDHNWWPPLLWKGQLRSVFSEPSRMGNYAAFALPFLWSSLLKDKNVWQERYIIVLTTLFTFFIFLTQARTPIGIYWGMLTLFIGSSFFLRKRIFFKGVVIVICVTAISFVASLGFINYFMITASDKENISASEFIEDNVGSLTSSSKRSNGARYALIRSNLKTGMEHPVFGVGNVLTSAYTVNNFSKSDLNNEEVSMWVKNFQKQGALRYSLDSMNEYISLFADYGSVGLIIFLVPALYALFGLFRRIRLAQGDELIKIYTILLSLIGSLVAGCNGSLTLLYTYWVVLAFAYAILFEGEKSISR